MLLLRTASSKWCVAYRIESFLITECDYQGHAPVVGF